MMSEFYDKDQLINVLQSHILENERSSVDWNRVIEDGEIYPNLIKGVTGCYIYQVTTISGFVTVFVHPTICTEVYFDGWTPKEVYMGRQQGEIW